MIRIILDDKLFTSPLGDKVDVRLNNSNKTSCVRPDGCSEPSEFSMLVAVRDSGPCECQPSHSILFQRKMGPKPHSCCRIPFFSPDSNEKVKQRVRRRESIIRGHRRRPLSHPAQFHPAKLQVRGGRYQPRLDLPKRQFRLHPHSIHDRLCP